MAFELKVSQKGQTDIVHMSGMIDASAGVAMLRLFELQGKVCVVNFKDVTAVNSYGLRTLLDVFRTFSGSRTLVFEHCSPAVVSQIAMISSFKGQASIRSIYGTYRCADCNYERLRLFELPHYGGTPEELASSSLRCDRCGKPMALQEDDDFAAVLPLLKVV